MTYLGIGVSALLLGFLGSVAGLGGGVPLVALLTVAFGYEIHQAIGSTMLALIPGAAIASWAYLRRRLPDLPLAFLIAVPTAAMTFVGAHLASILSAQALKPFFAALLCALAWHMFRAARGTSGPEGRAARIIRRLNEVRPIYRRVAVDVTGRTFRYQASLLLAGLLGCLAGLAGGLFGVGGGFLTTPVMVLAFRAPVRVAVATSLVLVGITAATGSFSHYRYGHVDLVSAAVMGVGLSAGGVLGPRFAIAASERTVQLIVAALLGAVGMALGASTLWSAS
jgi:hypothetical protein